MIHHFRYLLNSKLKIGFYEKMFLEFRYESQYKLILSCDRDLPITYFQYSVYRKVFCIPVSCEQLRTRLQNFNERNGYRVKNNTHNLIIMKASMVLPSSAILFQYYWYLLTLVYRYSFMSDTLIIISKEGIES
jgi:hypothetical protein